MTIVGLTVVFLALSLLVATVSALAAYMTRRAAPPPAAVASPAPVRIAAAGPAPQNPDLRLRVALAASAFHHHVTRRRPARPAVPAAGSPWLHAARAEQTARWQAQG